jgi:hypothetical protein
MCECESELATTFLPHQIGFASEYRTGKRIPVDGFAPNICAECRGEIEEPYPKAEIWGLKGKVERFYWREIFKTYCELLLEYYGHNFEFRDITEHDFAFPDVKKNLWQKSKNLWQNIHRTKPKHNTKERTCAELLVETPMVVREISAPYRQIERDGQKIGKWIDPYGNLVSVEELVMTWYKNQGFNVLKCERKLISVWVGTFLGVAIQDRSDPKTRLVMRGSTRGWTNINRNTPNISFYLPEDFGSANYYLRRREVIDSWSVRMEASPLTALYDVLLRETEFIRDYLWVADDDAVNLGRKALEILPKEVIVKSVKWAISDFWNRQSGWPDLLVFNNNEFRFSEVKSPHDKLSQDQMNWFEWALIEGEIPCELVRVKRMKEKGSI